MYHPTKSPKEFVNDENPKAYDTIQCFDHTKKMKILSRKKAPNEIAA
jgi:hypothetical protein